MRRLFAGFGMAGLLVISACGADGPAPAAPTPAPAPVTAPPATTPADGAPSPAGSETPTDPAKLDDALLQPEQLPGWERVDNEQPPLESTVEPAACQAIHDQTLGKVASDMGATAAFQRGDQFLQEYVDLVDRGADSVQAIEQSVAACPRFDTVDEGERTSVTVTPLAPPNLGDRSFGVRLTVQADSPAELLYLWAGHRDVVMMLHLDGPRADEPTLEQAARAAMERLQTQL